MNEKRIYDAVSIEYTYAMLFGGTLGSRGEPWDADVWRGGSSRKICKVLKMAGERIKERAGKVKFPLEMMEAGTPGVRILMAAQRLQEMAKEMLAQPEERTPNDYRWLVVADMVSVVDGLLTRLGV